MQVRADGTVEIADPADVYGLMCVAARRDEVGLAAGCANALLDWLRAGHRRPVWFTRGRLMNCVAVIHDHERETRKRLEQTSFLPDEPGTWQQPCPACGAPAHCKLRPDTVHHAESRCTADATHFRWLKTPQTGEETQMPKTSDMLKSKFLKASDVDEDNDLVVTITEVKQETLGQGKDAEDKWVVYFKEVDKGLVLNKVNINAIAKIHGDDTDDWENKLIALYATEVEFQGQTMLGLRVRLRAPKPTKGGKGKPAAEAASTPFDETVNDAKDVF